MIGVLKKSGEIKHLVLAQNLGIDKRLSVERWERLAASWRQIAEARASASSGKPSAQELFGAFQTRFDRYVRGVPDTEFIADLNKPNHLTLPPVWPPAMKLRFRQFLNISKLILHARFKVGPLRSFVPLANEREVARIFRSLDVPTQQSVIRQLLLWVRREKRSLFHPTWLTPVDAVRPGGPVEEELASVGVYAGDSVWIELRHAWSSLAAQVLAAPATVDGGSVFWFPSHPARVSIVALGWSTGYGMDLRRHIDRREPPLPELITVYRPGRWPMAWRRARLRIAIAEEARARASCVMDGDQPDIMRLRSRHARRIK
jgi:hypothetical protein